MIKNVVRHYQRMSWMGNGASCPLIAPHCFLSDFLVGISFSGRESFGVGLKKIGAEQNIGCCALKETHFFFKCSSGCLLHLTMSFSS